MTREEAILKAAAVRETGAYSRGEAARLVGVLEDLGLIKFDVPRDDDVSVSKQAAIILATYMPPTTVTCAIAELRAAGLKIVRRTPGL